MSTIELMITYIIIGAVSLVGNILVIFVVRKSKELRHSQYVYKCSIAVSDIIWGFTISYMFLEHCYNIFSKNFRLREIYHFDLSVSQNIQSNLTVYEYKTNFIAVMPSYMNKYNYNLVFHTISFYFKYSLMPISLFVSIFSLAFSAADKFCALNFPFKYKKQTPFN